MGDGREKRVGELGEEAIEVKDGAHAKLRGGEVRLSTRKKVVEGNGKKATGGGEDFSKGDYSRKSWARLRHGKNITMRLQTVKRLDKVEGRNVKRGNKAFPKSILTHNHQVALGGKVPQRREMENGDQCQHMCQPRSGGGGRHRRSAGTRHHHEEVFRGPQ